MNEKVEKRFKNVGKSKTFKNIVQTFSLNKKTVLDIGCSYGEFLVHFGKGSVGFTITPEEKDVGQACGLDVRLINIEETDGGLEKKFDAIFANNILEHMQSPHNFLLKIKNFLKPEGTLILGVPCIPKITWLMNFKKFRGSLASLHINFFNRDTLIKTAEFAGWMVHETRGFRLRNHFLDVLLNPIYPHFYIVAQVNKNFTYAPKRLKELEGYTGS
jgi:2-polyprenyl-3-methyl-5-hydroxy-6-metoxy-1,4-benzoquinol methylase